MAHFGPFGYRDCLQRMIPVYLSSKTLNELGVRLQDCIR